MKTLLTIIFIYLLVKQLKNMGAVLFKWQLIYAQVKGEIEKPNVLNGPDEDINAKIINITPYVMIFTYIVTVCFHAYFGLKYCSMYMLPLIGLFVFFVTLEYLSELPVPFLDGRTFPNLLANRLFCFSETASKIAYYIVGLLFLHSVI